MITQKKGKKEDVDDITFDDKGIMIIEERKRPRTAHEGEEEG